MLLFFCFNLDSCCLKRLESIAYSIHIHQKKFRYLVPNLRNDAELSLVISKEIDLIAPIMFIYIFHCYPGQIWYAILGFHIPLFHITHSRLVAPGGARRSLG